MPTIKPRKFPQGRAKVTEVLSEGDRNRIGRLGTKANRIQDHDLVVHLEKLLCHLATERVNSDQVLYQSDMRVEATRLLKAYQRLSKLLDQTHPVARSFFDFLAPDAFTELRPRLDEATHVLMEVKTKGSYHGGEPRAAASLAADTFNYQLDGWLERCQREGITLNVRARATVRRIAMAAIERVVPPSKTGNKSTRIRRPK